MQLQDARHFTPRNRLYYINLASVLQQRRLSGGNGRNANTSEQAIGGPGVDTDGNVYAIYGNPSGGYSVVVFDPTLQHVKRSLNVNFAPISLAIDPKNRLYLSTGVADGPIEVFAAGASGNAAPVRVITGSFSPGNGLAADATGRIFLAGNNGQGGTISTFKPDANGPQRRHIPSISGDETGLDYPQSITLGGDGNLYVVNQISQDLYGNYDILVFPETARGNVAPLRTIQSSTYGASLALGMDGEMYLGPIPKQVNKGIAIFAPGASGNPDPVGFVGPAITNVNETPFQMTLAQPWVFRQAGETR
jgi:sugar lactone lactonase YvrE